MLCVAGEALGRAERFSPAESSALYLLFPSQVNRLSVSTSSFASSLPPAPPFAPHSSLPVLAGQTLLPPPFIRLNLLKPKNFISPSPPKPPDFSHHLPPPHPPTGLVRSLPIAVFSKARRSKRSPAGAPPSPFPLLPLLFHTFAH